MEAVLSFKATLKLKRWKGGSDFTIDEQTNKTDNKLIDKYRNAVISSAQLQFACKENNDKFARPMQKEIHCFLN